MAITVMSDNEVNVTASADGMLYDFLAGHSNYIFAGIGNELEVSYSDLSRIATLNTGGAIICGRHVLVDATVDLQLQLDTSGYLVVEIDLNQAPGFEGRFIAVETLSDDNLNNGGSKNDIPLYSYTLTQNGVMTLTDIRVIKQTPDRVEVDMALNPNSNNPVANSVLKTELDAKANVSSLGTQCTFTLSGTTLTITPR